MSIEIPSEDVPRKNGRLGPTRGAVILFIVAIVSTIVLVAAGTAFAIYNATHHTDVVTGKQQVELQASCKFWHQLSVVPVTPVPPVKTPSKLGISIVIGSRYAYLGQECGKLPPPSPELEKWAAYYNLSLPG